MNFIQPIRAKISVDLQRPSKNVIHVVEDDSARGASIALYSGGEPFEPVAATYVVTYKKPDGTRGFYDAIDGDDAVTASGNVLTVRFVDQMLTVPGEVQINIRMESSTAGVARTFAITAIVHETAVPEGAESTDFFDVVGVQMREIADSDGYFDDDTVEGALAELGAYMAGGGGGSGMSNPMTAAGDIIVGGSSGAPARLAKGTDGKVLTMSSGSPVWSDPVGGGMENPMRGSGEIIYSNVYGSPAALSLGLPGQILAAASSAPEWKSASQLGLQTTAITDSGGYFTADTVNGALQEIGAELAGVNTLLGGGM